jgi:hypothetical protein
MSIRKPGIPVVQTQNRTMDLVFSAMKENIEIITGARPNTRPITQLTPAAANDEIIAKINELIVRLNFNGE